MTRIKPLAVLLTVPVLLSGCSAFGSSGAGSTPGPAGAPAASGGRWVVVTPGRPTPSARPTGGSGGGAYVLPWTPLGSGGSGGPATPAGTPTSTCSPNTFTFSKIAAAAAVTSATSAVVSWYNVGGATLKEFRITAISQDLVDGGQRDVGWVTVPPVQPCGPMSATVTGLDRATGYVFSVDAVVQRRSGDGTHAATVARSPVVRTR